MDITFDLFLSHNWGKDTLGRDNHDRVAKLNKALIQAQVKPWFDADQLGGHIGQAMCDGIDSCEKVAVFITRRYIDKVATKVRKFVAHAINTTRLAHIYCYCLYKKVWIGRQLSARV